MSYSSNRQIFRTESRNFAKLIADASDKKWARVLLEQGGYCDIIRGQDDGEWLTKKSDTDYSPLSAEYIALSEEVKDDMALINDIY